ncbi:hypothetical protein [Aminobacter niigataensis]|uniref:hypothetical protein n=1 Tax=Aminobacter niigataensis TaxID=83265 RepID=UPI0022839737|nr:hypothetical protein [Aminobacter niigataensis]CAI2936507.1 conserved protein of unknown function [Aminobacter niigataensis]
MAYDPIETWKTMQVKVWPEEYYLVDLPVEHLAVAVSALEKSTAKYCTVTRDQFGFSLVIDVETWRALGIASLERKHFGPLKVLSTNSELPFDVPGFIRTALEPVNARRLKAAPVCGLRADHFFTGADQLDEVVEIFETFSGGVTHG